MFKQTLRLVLLPAVAAVLVACGGGGGGGSGLSGQTTSLSGTAATGAPIANAKVYVVDSLGRTPTGQDEANGVALATTNANGQYNLTSEMLRDLKGPFMVRVVGQMLTESGEMGPAVFHAVTEGAGATTVNLTPLTEAHAALTLGRSPSLAYGNTSAMQTVTTANLADANASLADALVNVANYTAAPDFVSDPLDATPGAANLGNARMHDATLDQLSVSVSNGRIILADRNQDESSYVNGPRLEISPSSREVLTPSGPLTTRVDPLDLNRAKSFAERFTTQLAAGCDVEKEPLLPSAGDCSNVTNSLNNIFHPNFKDKGMSSWRWVRGWLADAFETTNLTGVSVSVVSSALGSFITDDGQRVYRILLRFSKGDDVVMRQILVSDDGEIVKAYGNQKNFFFYMAPRFNHKVDANGKYPYYPKYEQGLGIFLKPWFGGQNDVIFGAHVAGPGLPTFRQPSGLIPAIKLTAGVDVNRNGLANGVEVFDRRGFGCAAFPVEPSVYVERNLEVWTNTPNSENKHRQRPDSTSCNPLFDFLRYDVQRESNYVLPKKGDVYDVTLYLDALKFSPHTSVSPPTGANEKVTRKTSDGVEKKVLLYKIQYTLTADAFALPDTNFNPNTFGFPGVTDATRINLAQLEVGQDLAIAWTRNKTILSDSSVFGSYLAGRFMSSYDQWRTVEGTVTPLFRYDNNSFSENYSNLQEYNHGDPSTVYSRANCGKSTIKKYRNGLILTNPLIQKGISPNLTYSSTTCSSMDADLDAAVLLDQNAKIVYSNQRVRKQYVSDRARLVATNDKSQILSFKDLISREKNGDLNFCSAYKGLIRSRQVYVQLSDVNGRQLMEMRDVWWDFPGKQPYPGANVSDRPNQDSDPLYLTNTSVGKDNYNGERGFVHAVQAKQGTQCVDKSWN